MKQSKDTHYARSYNVERRPGVKLLLCSGIAAVARKIKLNHPNEKTLNITVGVDGTVYKKHPTFSKLMADKVKTLCAGSGVDVDFALSYDGSGKGAALVTAVAYRMVHSQVR